MSERILFVDDDQNVLAGFARQLRKGHAVETAPGGAEGLEALAARGPFAVVVSDMRMPGMAGAEFLARVRERSPDAVRLLLTGYADLQSAIDAVNRGGIFRFLTKPCPPGALAAALDDALAQYRLVTAQRELLERTLRGSVQVLGEVLALASPEAFGRAVRVQQLVRRLAAVLPEAGAWQVDVAAVLSQLGCVAVPDAVLAAAGRGADLDAASQQQLDSIPEVTRHLLRHIPRLDAVTEVIAYRDKPFDAPPRAGQERCGAGMPIGARVLRVAFDFDALVSRGVPEPEAVDHLESRMGRYDPGVLSALDVLARREGRAEVCEVAVAGLASGMVLADDLHNDGGLLLLSRGTPITEPLKRRLEAAAGRGQAPKFLRVTVPEPCGAGAHPARAT